ncbi:MAG TPA: sulfotransferase [Gammaproteobacteria bacterium]|nr:sulfotransferase [Gammaproteobacteria bacterium]
MVMGSANKPVEKGGAGTSKKQVFIIGSRRSGTTWTLWLLSDHPSIVGIQHTNLIDAFKKINSWWLDDEKIHNSIVSGKDEKIKANLKDFMTESDFYGSCHQMISSIFNQSFNEKAQASVVVESQPENVDNLDLLMKLFPDAYYLHVIRDPRSVFGSWKSIVKTWSSEDVFHTHPVEFAERWKKDVLKGRGLSEKARHYMEIQYEDMKSNGASVLKSVYNWLAVDDSDELVRHALESCEMQKLKKKGNMPKGFFRKGLSDGWKTDLTTAEVQSVEYQLKDLMDDLGYERVNKGDISEPAIVKHYYMKKSLKLRLKKTLIFNLLRKVKRRLTG